MFWKKTSFHQARAKLRGKFSRAASGTFGKCGRGGQAALVRRQYFDKRDSLDPALRDCVWFHRLLSEWVAPRQIDLALKAPVSVCVYSDASFQPQSCNPARLGFVLLPPGKSDGAVGMSVDVPPCALRLRLASSKLRHVKPC